MTTRRYLRGDGVLETGEKLWSVTARDRSGTYLGRALVEGASRAEAKRRYAESPERRGCAFTAVPFDGYIGRNETVITRR